MLKEIKNKKFANGVVYSLETEDGYPIEVTDTFLPYYTKDAIGNKQNKLSTANLGSRDERWMIGVSVMSGCPVRCKFCATGQLKRWRNLTSEEILEQIDFILMKHIGERGQPIAHSPYNSKEFKINYTRMGEPFLNMYNVYSAVDTIKRVWPMAHQYISTIGIRESDFKNVGYNWIDEKVTLQFSIHALNDKKRNWLIPYKNKLSLEEIGKIRTGKQLNPDMKKGREKKQVTGYNKTTLNMTLVDERDFDINVLKQYFNKDSFFVKLSPINPNTISEK